MGSVAAVDDSRVAIVGDPESSRRQVRRLPPDGRVGCGEARSGWE